MINLNDIKIGSYFIDKNGEALEVFLFSLGKKYILFKYISTGDMYSVDTELVLKNKKYRMASEEETFQINKRLIFK